MKEIMTNNHLKHESNGELSRLRDHFAGLAMQGLLSSPKLGDVSYAAVSEDAYIIADAMLKQRSLTNA